MSTFTEMSPIPIKELLIEATFAPNRALRFGVDAIDLGVLGQESERIYDRSAGGQSSHYSIPAVITSDRRLLLHKDIDSSLGLLKFYLSSLRGYKLDQKLYLAANIHNYMFDASPLPRDLGDILMESTSDYASTCIFISNPKIKMVVFRGEKNPDWTFNKTIKMTEIWDKALEETIDRSGAEFTTKNRMVEKMLDLRRKFFKRAVSEYGLQAFSCPLRENIARRMIF